MSETQQPQQKPKVDVAKILESLGVGREEAIAKAISELTDVEKLEFITYIYPVEDDNLALMSSIAERYNYSWLQYWVKKKLKLRTSLMGLRANQLTNIASEKRREEASRFRLFSFLRREKKHKGLGEVEEFE